MTLLNMPKVPLEYEMNQKVKKAVYSLENKFESIEAVSVFDGKVNVLGSQDSKSIFSLPIHYDIITNLKGEIIKENEFLSAEEELLAVFGFFRKRSNIKKRLIKERGYKDKLMEIEQQNMDDIKKAIAPIKLFKEPIEEVEKLLKKPLEWTETRGPEADIEKPDKFGLLVEAYIIGADHLVDVERGSSIGTPVKYVDR